MKAGASIKANAGSAGPAIGTGGASVLAGSMWPSQYQYYFTGILPAEPYLSDPASLAYFWRDIYQYDSIGGSVVDLMLNLPYSDFMLQGIDNKLKHYYEDAVHQLDMRGMFQSIGWAYYVDGFFCGTMIYDPRNRRFSDTMIHDALSCAVRTSPFWNKDPNITVTTSNVLSQFLHSSSNFNQRYVNSLPEAFRELLQQGRFDLNPATTLFVPRKKMTDRPYVSYLQRILPMYLIEKAMFRGTLTEAQRRQRAMTHITVGDSDWTPSPAELAAIVNQFMTAEMDPLGGWITTRAPVQATDLRGGGDFWKWTDMMDQLASYKLRALGVSEAFLGSDGVTFQAHEAAYSMFMEGQNEERLKLTHRVFTERIFPTVAIINGLYKDKKNINNRSIEDYFYNATDRANLIMPRVHWLKDLTASDESDTFDMLEKASEHGVPIPMRRYMAAAKIDPDSLIRELEDDMQLREVLGKFTEKDTSHEADTEASEDSGEDDYGDLEARARKLTAGKIFASQGRPKVPLLSRFSGVPDEVYDYTRTGKKKAVPSVLQAGRRQEANRAIAKIHAQVNRDPNYRMSLMKRNAAQFGKAKFTLG